MSSIVLIDSASPGVVNSAAEYLRRKGHTVMTPSNSEELVAVCLDSGPDVVAMPVMVPQSDAFLVLARLREAASCKQTRYLLISPMGPLGEPERAWDLHIHACLPRPYTEWHLILCVEQLIYRDVSIPVGSE